MMALFCWGEPVIHSNSDCISPGIYPKIVKNVLTAAVGYDTEHLLQQGSYSETMQEASEEMFSEVLYKQTL